MVDKNIIRVGQELEVLLANASTGGLMPFASNLLNDQEIIYEGVALALDEAAEEQLELVSNPASSIKELEIDFKHRVSRVEKVANKYGVTLVPGSVFGVQDITRHHLKEDRLNIYDQLFGGENTTNRLGKICGLHNHVSRIPGREADQYNFMLALDPLFAFSSTTPVDDFGQNSVNNSRVRRVRYDFDQGFDSSILDSLLPNYIQNLAELQQRDVQRLNVWKKRLIKNGGDIKLFEREFKQDNTGYHSVRSRPNLPPHGTYEARAPDAVPLDVSLGIAGVYLGGNRRLTSNIPISISKEHNRYEFSDNRIMLPSYRTLIDLEQAGINNGLESDIVNNYLSELVDFAKLGLESFDHKYLMPLKMMLSERTNYSNRIMDFLKTDQGFSGQTVTIGMGDAVNLKLADWFKQSYQN